MSKQMTDPAREPFEKPDVRNGNGQLDVPQTFAADIGACNFDAATVADHALVPDTFVLAAAALPVLDGTENPLAEETIFFRLERSVVDRFRFGHFTKAPLTNFLRRCQLNPDRFEISGLFSCLYRVFLRTQNSSSNGLLPSDQELASLQLHIQPQTLQFFDENVERLGNPRFGRVLTL